MTKLLLISLIAIAVPSIVIVGGGWLMTEVSGRGDVKNSLQGHLTGYTLAQAKDYWRELGDNGRVAERQLLQFDLLFALLYSLALGFSIWLVWTKFDPGFSLVWLLIPVVLVLLADWFETWILLRQLAEFNNVGPDAVQAGPIAIASVATTVKWITGGVAVLTVYVLVAAMIFTRLRS